MLPLVGYILFTGALIGFACSNSHTGGLFIGMDVLAGFGFAMPLTFLTVVGQFGVSTYVMSDKTSSLIYVQAPPALIGTATALILSARTVGGSIGLAVSNTILTSKINKALPEYIAAAVLPQGLNPQLLGPVIGAAASGDPAVIAQVAQIPGVTPQM